MLSSKGVRGVRVWGLGHQGALVSVARSEPSAYLVSVRVADQFAALWARQILDSVLQGNLWLQHMLLCLIDQTVGQRHQHAMTPTVQHIQALLGPQLCLVVLCGRCWGLFPSFRISVTIVVYADYISALLLLLTGPFRWLLHEATALATQGIVFINQGTCAAGPAAAHWIATKGH